MIHATSHPGTAPADPAAHQDAGPIPEQRVRVPVEFGARARIALAHDWLCGYRGGEAVLERIAALVDREHLAGELYVMFDDRRQIAPAIDALRHVVSPIGRLGRLSRQGRRWLLPAYPSAVGALGRKLLHAHQRTPIDLLISTSSAAIKGMRAPPEVPHLCYCHTPARWIWAQQDQYAGGVRGFGLRVWGPVFRRWDRATAGNVTTFIANSAHTARQIELFYEREAHIIHPPVRTDFFTPDPRTPRTEFWLVVSALEPYKRVDLAIEAAAAAGAPLIVIGDGSERVRLEKLAGRNVRFLGQVGHQQLLTWYRRARLLLFPQVEDFGIVAVEAQACGLPVVARAQGGAVETVIDGQTGALFTEPDAAAIARAAARAPEPNSDTVRACRRNAERFSPAAFDQSMRAMIAAALRQSAQRGGRVPGSGR